MAPQRDDDRPGREHVRALVTACGVLLACGALAALVLTDDPKELRLAIVAALWAFLLVAITGRFRKQERVGGESDEELRHFYQLELQQEVAARKEYELRLEVQLRRELEQSRSTELADLRGELNRLRADLRGIEAPERALALLATRLTPENVRTLQDESLRAHNHRPTEQLQLPAAGSSSGTPPQPAEPAPSEPSYSSYSSQASLSSPELSPPAGGHERVSYASTEYLPAPRVAAANGNGADSSYGQSYASSYGSSSYGSVAPQPRAGAEAYTLPADSFASSDAYPRPSGLAAHAGQPVQPVQPAAQSVQPTQPTQPVQPAQPSWSAAASYETAVPEATPAHSTAAHSTAAHSTAAHSTGAHSTAAEASYGAHASPAHSSYPEIAFPEPEPGAFDGSSGEPVPWPEPFPTRGRHGALSVESSRADPFDPSNTWPDAFKSKRSDSTGSHPNYHAQLSELRELPAAPQPRESDSYPSYGTQSESRPARGRHHAEETGVHPAPPGRRPDDDVLAQILGRW